MPTCWSWMEGCVNSSSKYSWFSDSESTQGHPHYSFLSLRRGITSAANSSGWTFLKLKYHFFRQYVKDWVLWWHFCVYYFILVVLILITLFTFLLSCPLLCHSSSPSSCHSFVYIYMYTRYIFYMRHCFSFVCLFVFISQPMFLSFLPFHFHIYSSSSVSPQIQTGVPRLSATHGI